MPQGWAQLLIDALQFVNQFSRAFAKKHAPRMIAPKRLGLATCSKIQPPNAHKKSHIQPRAAKTVGFAVTYVAQRCLADPTFLNSKRGKARAANEGPRKRYVPTQTGSRRRNVAAPPFRLHMTETL